MAAVINFNGHENKSCDTATSHDLLPTDKKKGEIYRDEDTLSSEKITVSQQRGKLSSLLSVLTGEPVAMVTPVADAALLELNL